VPAADFLTETTNENFESSANLSDSPLINEYIVQTRSTKHLQDQVEAGIQI